MAAKVVVWQDHRWPPGESDPGCRCRTDAFSLPPLVAGTNVRDSRPPPRRRFS